MLTGLSVEDIQGILNAMVQCLLEGFKEQLIAVVVYGSYAQGKATPESDIDLLVVIKERPRDWEGIHRMEDKWTRKGRRLGKRFQIMLASPEDVEDSVEQAAPLMLEIYNTHKVIFDKNNFFGDYIRRMGRLMRERGIQMKKPGVWEVPEHAISP